MSGRRQAFSVPRRRPENGQASFGNAGVNPDKDCSNLGRRRMEPLGTSRAPNILKEPIGSDKEPDKSASSAFKVLYTARSSKQRKNKSWLGMPFQGLDAPPFRALRMSSVRNPSAYADLDSQQRVFLELTNRADDCRWLHLLHSIRKWICC